MGVPRMIYQCLPPPKLVPRYHRLLGLDLGAKWIGLALSDKLQLTATPHKLLKRGKTFAADAAALRAIIQEFEVGFIVLGYPLSLNGSKNSRTQASEAFARNLARHGDIDLGVLLWDERLTSQEANRVLEKEMDLSRARRAVLEDKMAAALILNSALEALGRAREAALMPPDDDGHDDDGHNDDGHNTDARNDEAHNDNRHNQGLPA